MNVRFCSLILLAGVLSPFSVSAQCSAPCVPMEGSSSSGFDHRLSKTLLLSRSEPSFWQRVKLGTQMADPSQAPFASGEAAPWRSTDFWQPRTSIRAEWAMYQGASPAGVRVSLGYVRGAHMSGGLIKTRGAAGIIVKMPFTLLD